MLTLKLKIKDFPDTEQTQGHFEVECVGIPVCGAGMTQAQAVVDCLENVRFALEHYGLASEKEAQKNFGSGALELRRELLAWVESKDPGVEEALKKRVWPLPPDAPCIDGAGNRGNHMVYCDPLAGTCAFCGRGPEYKEKG